MVLALKVSRRVFLFLLIFYINYRAISIPYVLKITIATKEIGFFGNLYRITIYCGIYLAKIESEFSARLTGDYSIVIERSHLRGEVRDLFFSGDCAVFCI